MDKLFEIGEIGQLRDIPSDLAFLTDENILLKQRISKSKIEKTFLVLSIVVLIIYIIRCEIQKNDNPLNY